MILLLARLTGLPSILVEFLGLLAIGFGLWGFVAYHDHKIAAAARAQVEAAVAKAHDDETARQAKANAAAEAKAKADAEWIAQLADERDALVKRLDDEIAQDSAARACGVDRRGVRRLNEIRRPAAAAHAAAGSP